MTGLKKKESLKTSNHNFKPFDLVDSPTRMDIIAGGLASLWVRHNVQSIFKKRSPWSGILNIGVCSFGVYKFLTKEHRRRPFFSDTT